MWILSGFDIFRNASENQMINHLRSVFPLRPRGRCRRMWKSKRGPTRWLALFRSVEAQGIEPWSETGSKTASTCVGQPSCRRAQLVTDQPSERLSPIDLADSVRAPEPASPDFRFGNDAPGGLRYRRCVKRALAQLTQPAPDQNWRLNRSKWFSQDLGPGHAAIPSSDPSKPIAPGLP